jgi:hypothetical protein
MAPSVLRAAKSVEGPGASGRRLVAINTSFGFHAPYFFPKTAGRNYEPTPYLEVLQDFREDFTVFSGMSHPEVDGGHSAEASYLTAAPHPRDLNFKNSISVDQLIAEKMIGVTRLPYLILANAGRGMSWTRSGVPIPPQSSPAKVFEQLFVNGRGDDVAAQKERLRRGQSILDRVLGQARKLQGELGDRDRQKLDEYLSSVREVEMRLQAAEAWTNRPKPQVDVPPLKDVTVSADTVGASRLMFDLTHLALQTDSTRIVTIGVNGLNAVPPIPGISIDHHNLSHHGRDPAKIEQLKIIELLQMEAFRDFLAKLKGTQEAGGSLLQSTMVLFGSNLGNASSHDTKNMPIILAGGGFKHGQHLAFDSQNNMPLCNLFVTMLQRIGLETDRFASSTGSISLS